MAALITVLAHGCFDVLHSGHILHLREARTLGEELVVSITAGEYINKGTGRPYFTDTERKENLEALRCVDRVIISHCAGPEWALRHVMPNIYVKGMEYAGRLKEQALVEELGGRVVFLRHPKGSLIHSGQFDAPQMA